MIPTPNTALLTIANAAKVQATTTPGAQVFIDVVGNRDTEPLPKGARLGSWSSCIMDPEDDNFGWAYDENLYQANHARSVKRNFLEVNPPSPQVATRNWGKRKRRSDEPDFITTIEEFLTEQP